MTSKMALKPGPLLNRYRHFFVGLFVILLLSLAIVAVVHYLPTGVYEGHGKIYQHISLDDLDRVPEVVIATNAPLAEGRNPHCSYYDCFNVYRCGHTGSNKIQVYVYPMRKYVDERNIPVGSQMSREFYFILQTILESKYYTPNPEEACILVPSIDTLNQNRFRVMETSEALTSLP
jgi:glucuronyl/N-acetylglucosaminyl transferase EXT2